MRKVLLAVFAVSLVLGMGLAAYAAENEGYTVKGQVVSIDPEGKTIVINTAEGQKTVVFQEGVQGFKEVKPGMSVEMTCIDLEGKACAKDIKVVSVEEAGKPTRTFEGEVVSIDPEGKTVVIKSPKGEEMTVSVTAPAAVKMVPAEKAATTEEMLKTEAMPVKEIKPGTKVMLDCFDSGGRFCASRIVVVSSEEAGKPVEEVTGEVTSIDPAGKSVVIKTITGERTLYYQKVTTGPAPSELEVGKKVKAYCLDVEGKSCIKNIQVTE